MTVTKDNGIAKMVLTIPKKFPSTTFHFVTLTGRHGVLCTEDSLTAWIGTLIPGSRFESGGKYKRCVSTTNSTSNDLQACSFRCDCSSWTCDAIQLRLELRPGLELCQVDFA